MMRRLANWWRWMAAAALAAALVLALPVSAQESATLVADRISVVGDQLLVAEGHVEIFYQGRILRAERLTYDRKADTLTLEGPIVLQDGPDNLLLADSASLSSDLRNGILTSARMVMNRELQLAAAEIVRVDDRYTALNRVVASSCRVCAGSLTPLWEIRARRVVHDQLERQIYFDDATFHFAGVPLMYLPRLRIPDPTLDRATGFMMPALSSSSRLGTALQWPYFIVIGPSRDLLLTPFAATGGARALGMRYRQAFSNGTLTLEGTAGTDPILPGQLRGLLRATGDFDLRDEFHLGFRAEMVSDQTYLLDYGLGERDRIDSRLELTRTRRHSDISARLIGFQTLREGEAARSLPAVVADIDSTRRLTLWGGEALLSFGMHNHARPSTSLLDGDGDGIADGRDLSRGSARLEWRRSTVGPAGIEMVGLGALGMDIYQVWQDPTYTGYGARIDGTLGVELRWPLLRNSASGATEILEPVAQLLWTESHASDGIPNEDSTLVEFDEGNLFALSRFPGHDAVETGLRANLGVSYLRTAPSGWTLGVVAGRVIRASTGESGFTQASGLARASSDWLLGWRVDLPNGLQLANRLVLAPDLALTKGELRFDLQRENYGVTGSFLHVIADPAENRADPMSEITLEGRHTLGRSWTALVSGRYDLAAQKASRTGAALQFRNECLAVDLSLSRRFTSSTTLEPSTDFGLTVQFLGFGGGDQPGPARTCRR